MHVIVQNLHMLTNAMHQVNKRWEHVWLKRAPGSRNEWILLDCICLKMDMGMSSKSQEISPPTSHNALL